MTPGFNVRIMKNIAESRWHALRLSLDFCHKDVAKSGAKTGGLVVIKLPSGAVQPVSMRVVAQTNENDDETTALLRVVDAAVGNVIGSAPDSDPRTWNEVWGDQKVTSAIRKYSEIEGIHIYDDFKHLVEKAPRPIRGLLRQYVMRSLPETAARVKDQMVAEMGQDAVDAVFESGKIENVAVSRRAADGLIPNGDIFAYAETHNSVHKEIGARSTAVTTAMELMFQASFSRLIRDYNELVAARKKRGEQSGTPHWRKRQEPQLKLAEGCTATRISHENSTSINYRVVLGASRLSVIAQIHVYNELLEATSATAMQDTLSQKSPCTCRHFHTQGTWCAHLLAALATHKGVPPSDAFDPPPCSTLKAALESTFGENWETEPPEDKSIGTYQLPEHGLDEAARVSEIGAISNIESGIGTISNIECEIGTIS